MPARECSLLETFQLRILTSNAHTKFVVSAHVLLYCILPNVFCRLYFLLFAVYCVPCNHARACWGEWMRHNEPCRCANKYVHIKCLLYFVYYLLTTVSFLLPRGHLVPKWRRINVDATSSRRIDVDTTSFWNQMPAGGYCILRHCLGAIVKCNLLRHSAGVGTNHSTAILKKIWHLFRW